MSTPLASLETYDITATEGTGAVMLVPIASWVVGGSPVDVPSALRLRFVQQLLEHLGDKDLRGPVLRVLEQLHLSLASTDPTYGVPHLLTGPGSR